MKMATRRELLQLRAELAMNVRQRGHTFGELAQVLGLVTKAGRPWKERARQLAAKGARLHREKARQCTCPATVDITFTGHLYGCPAL